MNKQKPQLNNVRKPEGVALIPCENIMTKKKEGRFLLSWCQLS